MKKLLLVAALVAAQPVLAEDTHQVYVDLGWKHFSNVDAGYPFNDDPEDNMDHVGVALEYQFHPNNDDDHFYATLGVGWSKFNRQDGSYNGWECSGCSLPSSLTVGYKWRVW